MVEPGCLTIKGAVGGKQIPNHGAGNLEPPAGFGNPHAGIIIGKAARRHGGEQPGALLAVRRLRSQARRHAGQFVPRHFPQRKCGTVAIIQNRVSLGAVRQEGKRSLEELLRELDRGEISRQQIAPRKVVETARQNLRVSQGEIALPDGFHANRVKVSAAQGNAFCGLANRHGSDKLARQSRTKTIMAQKIEIPQSLKADLPPTAWGKMLAATPIVLAVIATMLAGLASSEMTKAQYDRSMAAQLQSKAGDQWGYFQAKKLRSASARNTLDLLAATAVIHPLAAEALGNADAATVAAFTENQLPAAMMPKFEDTVQAALDALGNSAPDTEIAADLAKVKDSDLVAALKTSQQAALDFDNATKPINRNSDKLDDTLMSGDQNNFRGFSAARLRYTAARYDAEARLNFTIASIYELQVRKSNASAEKHHARSGKFFFGMLAAQLAVIIATFAIAARQRNFLWSVAAAAGLAAVSFSVYVFLYV